jgi:hypothetical protein
MASAFQRTARTLFTALRKSNEMATRLTDCKKNGASRHKWLYDDLAVGFEGRLDAQLCSEAQHGQILVSDSVLRLVKELVRAESMV